MELRLSCINPSILSLSQACLKDEKVKCKEAEDSAMAHLDQIEELTHKVTMAESKIASMEANKAAEESKVSGAFIRYQFVLFYLYQPLWCWINIKSALV